MKASILIFSLLLGFVSQAQQNSSAQLDALNNYVNFINESIHGMLIAHRLLENYNQDINKYADLEGYQINNFSNKDLPSNIFEDPDNWFYEVSPYQLYNIAINSSSSLPTQEAVFLNNNMKKLKADIDGINRIRFTIPDYIDSHELQNKEELQGVYDLLEAAVTLFDDFFEVQKKMEIALIANARKLDLDNSEIQNVIDAMDRLWFTSKNILRSVRAKQDENLSSQVQKLNAAVHQMKTIDLASQQYTRMNSTVLGQKSWALAITKASKISTNANELLYTAEVPMEYKLYGKFYFYHNAIMTTQTNRYGFGFIHELNKVIDDAGIQALYRIEEPHFYRVIYPKKLQQEEGLISSSDDDIKMVPVKLKDRTITSSSRTIDVDTLVFELSLYDHKIQDGDIVSINFNGDWILEKHSLEGSATFLKLKLNKEGKNYLILHAENEGKNPPNTMAISYSYQGKKQTISLSSNLSESELIEINYKPNL